MSQEEKIIKVYLESQAKEDYMIFGFENEMKVCMNNENCQNELKSIFSILLQELVNQPIKLEYEERKEYKTGLYIDVCTEYIKDLNREITNVRNNFPEKLTFGK